MESRSNAVRGLGSVFWSIFWGGSKGYIMGFNPFRSSLSQKSNLVPQTFGWTQGG